MITSTEKKKKKIVARELTDLTQSVFVGEQRLCFKIPQLASCGRREVVRRTLFGGQADLFITLTSNSNVAAGLVRSAANYLEQDTRSFISDLA